MRYVNHDGLQSENEVLTTCAKTDDVTHYVKADNGGFFFDPHDALGRITDLYSQDTLTGRAFYYYTLVSKDVYESYETYLRTRSRPYLTTAQRDHENLRLERCSKKVK